MQRRAHHRAVQRSQVARERPDGIEMRIGKKIRIDPGGCWIYGDPDEYQRAASFTGDSPVLVHRFVYETLVGPIPDGHHLHHKCEVKGCCNPEHLEALTPLEHAAAHRESRAESTSSSARA